MILKFALSIVATVTSVVIGASHFQPEPVPVAKTVYLDLYDLAAQPSLLIADPVIPKPVYRHGDCSWLPAMALKAGWEPDQLDQLEQIVQRESGCCPNRRGGDAVDADCRVTKVTEWNHRSDTGLLQINGLNYDTGRNEYALLCRQMGICSQEPLLDPLTNLRAGKAMFDYWEDNATTGWHPWDPCLWGAEYKAMCKKAGGKKAVAGG